MAIKTKAIALPELTSALQTVDTANAGENDTVNSLFFTHRNEPNRYDVVSTPGTTPIDFAIGNRISNYQNNSFGTNLFKVLGDDFILMKMFETEATPTNQYFNQSNSTRSAQLQLQRLINGKIVTGPALAFFTSSTASDNTLVFDACEIQPGIILVIYNTTSSSIGTIATYSYNATTLALTFLTSISTTTATSNIIYSVSMEKIINGRAYYVNTAASGQTNPWYLNLIKVSANGLTITDTSNVLGGNIFTDPGHVSVYFTPNISSKFITRATATADQFVIGGFNSSSYFTWTTVSFNSGTDATTVLARGTIGEAIQLGTGLDLIPAYGTTGFRVYAVYNLNSTTTKVIGINSSGATTPALNTTFSNMRNNPNYLRTLQSGKIAYFTSFQATGGSTGLSSPLLTTFTWTDGTLAPTIQTVTPTGIYGPFPVVFNSILYMADVYSGSNIPVVPAYERFDSAGNSYEIAKIYNGTPRLDLLKVKWSSALNMFISAQGAGFYLFSRDGTFLGVNRIQIPSGQSYTYTYFTAAFDINASGNICAIISPADYFYGQSFSTSNDYNARYVEFKPIVNGGFASITSFITNSRLQMGSAATDLFTVNDMVCMDTGMLVSGVNYNPNTAAYAFRVLSFPYGIADNYANTTVVSENTANNAVIEFITYNSLFKSFIYSPDNTTTAVFCYQTTTNPSILYFNRTVKNAGAVVTTIANFTTTALGNYDTGSSTNMFLNNKFAFFKTETAGGFAYQPANYSIIYVNGILYTPSSGSQNLRKISVGRAGAYAAIVEEYTTKKVVRVYDETNGLFASEKLPVTTYTESSSLQNSWFVSPDLSTVTYTGNTRDISLRSPGAKPTILDVFILKSDGTTLVPVLTAYEITVGGTLVLGSPPIYLASGDKLQLRASRMWSISASGMAIVRTNT